ncbi:MAG: M48 family metalloprotease [Cyanobacteriota bacterium]|nr:M48 family metalloprotease [Cyanobacteriota bacterium]
MKSMKYILQVAISTLLLTGGNGSLSVLVPQPAKAADPSIELKQNPKQPAENAAPSPENSAPELRDRLTMFLEADELYRQGDREAAVEIYRQLKPEFDLVLPPLADPIYEAEALPPEGLAHWETAQAQMDADNPDGAIEALQTLIEAHPEFVLAPLELAEILKDEDREEEAILVLEQAASRHPDDFEIVMTQVKMLSKEDRHLEASIAAREFSVLYLDHPDAAEFAELADKELKKHLDSQSLDKILKGVGGGLLEVLTGGNILDGIGIDVGGFLSGGDAIELEGSAAKIYEIGQMMFEDESEFGARLAQEYKQQLTLVEDDDVNHYVTQLGMQIAQFTGRDFDYEFYVVQDNSMNAFALPGGKVFVNTGLILAANSQAELAGVLAHEVAHAVLSHGIQSVLRDDIVNQVFGELSEELSAGDLGNFVSNLVNMDYSREQERQADILGTRVLARAGYAADGLYNFMTTLAQNTAQTPVQVQDVNVNTISIPVAVPTESLSSHPTSENRVEYLEELILRNGYDRYALEGVDKHSEIKEKLGQSMQ